MDVHTIITSPHNHMPGKIRKWIARNIPLMHALSCMPDLESSILSRESLKSSIYQPASSSHPHLQSENGYFTIHRIMPAGVQAFFHR
jgi:hypothetical protein